MLWLICTIAIATPFIVIGMMSPTGLRTRGVNEGSEMEKGSIKVAEGEEMILRRGSGSMGVWRVENGK